LNSSSNTSSDHSPQKPMQKVSGKPKSLYPLSQSPRIGVLCGGLSSEREVSLRSGKNCIEALQRLGYTQSVMIDVDRSVAQTLTEKSIEVAFLALHGSYGEDGAIQGMLDYLNIPYTGNDLTASALTMNKDLTKKILKEAGLPVIPSVSFNLSNGRKTFSVAEQLRYPVMVKPLNEGSSIGMSKVDEEPKLLDALHHAAQYCSMVMVEEFIPGKSITVGVIDINGTPQVTPILELRTKTEWYDLEAKYTHGLTEFILPAELSEKATQAIQATTLQAHKAAGCHGVSRIDFVVDAQEAFYILEINTIPGMTDLSDLPAQAKTMGISYDQLVEYILQTAYH
jgi:D-alanine-D-alanine ligase